MGVRAVVDPLLVVTIQVDVYEGVLLGLGLIVIGVVVLFLFLILIDRRGR